MKKKGMIMLATVLVTSCLLFSPVFAADESWASKASIPTARAYLNVAVVNQTIYAIAGGGPAGTNEAYNPTTNNWTTKASMPNPQPSFAIASCKDKIYCIGGMPSGFTGASSMNMVYDPVTDSWDTKTAMPTARFDSQAQVVNDKIYLIGGNRLLGYDLGFERLNVTEIYDPATDAWSTGSPIPIMEDCVSAVMDGRIYVIGQTTQIYNPKTDSWSTGVSPPYTPIYGDSSAAAATNGVMAPKRIYVYNGSILQIYNPKADNWTLGTSPPTNRQSLSIGVVDDRLYFIGGMSYPIPGLGQYYIFHDANEEYTPAGYGVPEPSESQLDPGNFLVFAIVLAAVAAAVVSGVVVYLKKRK